MRDVTTLQGPVFLVNSRHPLFSAAQRSGPSFCRSDGVNLPSSFKVILSYALVYSTSSPVWVLVRCIGAPGFFLQVYRVAVVSWWWPRRGELIQSALLIGDTHHVTTTLLTLPCP